MHPSLLLLFAVPAVLLLGVFTRAGAAAFRALRQRRIPPAATLVRLFAGLIAIAAVLSLLVILNAALGHSQQAKAASRWYGAGIFLLVVGLPALVVVLRIRRIRASAHPAAPSRT